MLETTIKSTFITDLAIPHASTFRQYDGNVNGGASSGGGGGGGGPWTASADELDQLSYDTALELLHDFPAFIRSNPLVTKVERIDSTHEPELLIDIPAFRSSFGHDHGNRDGEDDGGHGDDRFVQYSITDRLKIVGFQSDLVYQSALRKTSTGFESYTNPGSGVKIHGSFDIRRPSSLAQQEQSTLSSASSSSASASASASQPSSGLDIDDNGVIHLIEHNETKCNILLAVYIKATLASSHKTLHENFKRAWNEALKRKLGILINHNAIVGGGGASTSTSTGGT